jgi:release factor glutamine methyltransferase
MGQEFSLRTLLSTTLLPPNEARILMAHVLEIHHQLPRSALISRDDLTLNTAALESWRSLEFRRLQGEPVAYLIGKKGFHNIELLVGPGVLIPRPETELLVEIGLQEIKCLDHPTTVLDLGTGSGAVALAIAHAEPKVLVTATDRSAKALEVAQKNAKHLQLENRVQFLQGSWYTALDDLAKFDLILSNPPYIPKQDPHLGQGDLRFEPISALTDESDGLQCLRAIISGADDHLTPNGLIAVEHGFNQSDAVLSLMDWAGFDDIQAHRDLAGHKRVATGRKRDVH